MKNIERHGRPLLEAIAAWEREHGSICAMLPDEYHGFMTGLKKAALGVHVSARGAVEPDPITLYVDDCEYTFIDCCDHVLLQDGSKKAVLVTTIYEDEEGVGPENTEAVCPNIAAAHRFIDTRFNTDHMHAERVDGSPLSSYRLFFGNESECNFAILLQLIDMVE